MTLRTYRTLAGWAVAATLATWPLASMAEPAHTDDASHEFIRDFSYAIGRDIMRNAMENGLMLDPDAVRRGIMDERDKKPMPFSNERLEALQRQAQAHTERFHAERRKKQLAENQAEEKRFLADNAQKTGVQTLPEGVQYKILKAGEGPLPKPGDYLVVHYEGRHLDGRVFDSSYERGAPLRIKAEDMIKGWQIVLSRMHVGDKWRVFIPARLAYGDRGADDVIQPGEMLIFDMELLSIEPDDADQDR